jgi:two-component system, NtrC family, sensor histidine kinase KinB
MTLKKKMLFGYGAVFILVSVVILWAIVNIIFLGRAAEEILSENYRSILAADNMACSLAAQQRNLLTLLSDEENEQKLLTEIQDTDSLFLQWFSRAQDNVTIEGEQEIVDDIEQAYREYRTLLFGTGVQEFSYAQYQETYEPLSARITSLTDKLLTLNEHTMYNAQNRASAAASRAVWSTSVVAAAAFIIALFFIIVLAEKLVRPLTQFIEASRLISAGDYTTQVPLQTHDELGLLAGEFNLMVSKLKHYHELNIEHILTEKSKSEAILASIEDGLIVFNPDLAVTGINPSAKAIFALDISDYRPLSCEDFIHDPGVCGLIRETVNTGKNPSTEEHDRVLIVEHNDTAKHFLSSVTPIRGKEGEVTGAVLLLRDVTSLKEVERMKSEFIMAASHELRTPLTSLGMSLDLIRRTIEPTLQTREKELLSVASEEVGRMKEIVHNLLDLSRLEAGSIDLQFEKVPISRLFNHVKDIFSSQVEMKGAALEVSEPDSDTVIEADVNKLTWVLSNLISNALRYVRLGGHIRMAALKSRSNLQISVEDDGPGIPVELQSKIFQKFVQAGDGGGSGLGLAICKEIIRAHSGSIWVESEAGEGSTFICMIPISRRAP